MNSNNIQSNSDNLNSSSSSSFLDDDDKNNKFLDQLGFTDKNLERENYNINDHIINLNLDEYLDNKPKKEDKIKANKNKIKEKLKYESEEDEEIQKYNNNILDNLKVDNEQILLKQSKKKSYQDEKLNKAIYAIIKENTVNNNLCSDISKVDYNKYYIKKGVKLEELNDPLLKIPFCDNITLFKLIPLSDVKLQDRGRWEFKNENKEDNINSKGSLTNKELREILKNFNIPLDNKSVSLCGMSYIFVSNEVKNKINNCNPEDGTTRQHIHNILKNNPDILKRYMEKIPDINKTDKDNIFYISLKIDLNEITLESLLNKLKNGLQQQMILNGFVIKDIDITKDYKNSMDRNILKDYLINNLNYNMEGENIDDKDEKIILNNIKNVGNNIITFLEKNEFNETIRTKLYAKVICQWTSGGVRKIYGNNIRSYIDPKSNYLKKLFQEGKDTSITRLEFTIYTSNINFNLNYYEEIIKKLEKDICYQPLYFQTPIYKQWNVLQESLNNNLIILNRYTNMFYIIYYVNSLTGKILSITKSFQNQFNKDGNKLEYLYNIRNFILSTYSYHNKHINYLEILYNKDDNNLNILKQTYFKPHDNITYLNYDGFLYDYKTEKLKNDELINIGFNMEGSPFIFNIFKKEDLEDKTITFTKTTKAIYKIYDETVKNKNIMISLISEKKRKKIINDIEYREYINKQLELLTQNNNDFFIYFNKKIEEKEAIIIRLNIIDLFIDQIFINKKLKSLKDLYVNDDIIIKCFYYINSNTGNNKTIILCDQDNNKYYSDCYNTKIIDSNINKFIQYTHSKKENNYTIFSLDIFNNYDYLYTLKKIGLYQNSHGNKSNKYTLLYNNLNLSNEQLKELELLSSKIKEDRNNLININNVILNNRVSILNDIYNNIKLTDTTKMDELENNNQYKIISIKQLEYRKNIKYIFKLENDNNIYSSNYFLEQNIINNNIDINNINIIIIKTLMMKTTPTKNKNLNNIILSL